MFVGNIPSGPGMFIWILSRLGTPAQVVAMLKAANISWVAIKFQNGTYLADGRTIKEFEDEKPEEYVAAIRAAGIYVVGWGYVYGNPLYVSTEIEVTLKAINRFNLGSWIINAEQEYKRLGNKAEATKMASRYAGGLRAALPQGYNLGITTYRYILRYHSDFPIEPFANVCSYTVPQVYWVNDDRSTGAGKQLKDVYAEYMKVKKGWKFIPAGCAYSEGSWRPTVTQLKDFYDTAMEMGLDSWLWWEYNDALMRYTEWKSEIIRQNIDYKNSHGIIIPDDNIESEADKIRSMDSDSKLSLLVEDYIDRKGLSV